MADIMLSGARVCCEIGGAMYAADLLSGLVHLVGDCATIISKPLRTHLEPTMPKVKAFMETDPKFTKASARDQAIWNFQIHHFVPYPAAKDDVELFVESVKAVWHVFLVCVAATWYGYLPVWIARILLPTLLITTVVQNTHMDAHRRNHGVKLSPIVCFLQDYGVLLNPADHRKHHETFDCNFCLFNGWANPVVNRLFRALTACGILPEESPTVILRRNVANPQDPAETSSNEDDKSQDERSILTVMFYNTLVVPSEILHAGARAVAAKVSKGI